MYQELLPALFDDRDLQILYFVLPSLVTRARGFVGDTVYSLNSPWLRYALPTKGLRGSYYRRRVQWFVDRHDARAVVFNTIEPAVYFPVFRGLRHPLKIGIVHNPRRKGINYKARPSGELIFCLHDYNYQLLQSEELVDGYLSPFFRGFEAADTFSLADDTEIAVQGVVSFNRRNYRMLVDLCRELLKNPAPPRVIFNILGDSTIRDGPALRELVSEYGLQGFFRFHPWVPDTEFAAQLRRAHYIMPLLNRDEGPYAVGAKVTLAYVNSGAYRKPLLLHRDLAEQWSLPENTCVTYSNLEDLVRTLSRGIGNRLDLARRYERFVGEKITENRTFLRRLAREHEAFRQPS